jgi:hypothetical protein
MFRLLKAIFKVKIKKYTSYIMQRHKMDEISFTRKFKLLNGYY